MRLLALASTAFNAALFCSGVAYSLPSTINNHVVHEKRDSVADGWKKVSRASADTPLNLRIGLKQLNLDQAEEFVHSVSHPRSAQYGRFWTPQQVMEMFAPSRDAVDDTIAWLLKAGIPSKSIAPSAGRNWIKISTTVGDAESLLDTTYNVYESAEEDVELVACESYSLPADVRQHVDLVTPTIQFDTRGATIRQRVKRRDVLTPNLRKLPTWHKNHGAESLQNCSEVTTPACLRAL
jgi:tripeptidyl-peptidase-1